ncbi:MAG: type I polyketide synthase, partial [Flavobacteriales bacterium]|nr:type I polyketide synthase [Flavobacteriales bacterium]
KYTGLEIAIVGIGCRFPGAQNKDEFWDNLIKGKRANREMTEEELAARGLTNDDIQRPNYVNSISVLENKDKFDFAFFNYTPDEATLMNPQHRIFHECLWEAIEDAGCNPDKVEGGIGIYAGAGEDLNWKLYSSIVNADHQIGDFLLARINDKDYLASLLSYKLNLSGPAFSVNSACSTSLLAVHTACRALLLGETKVALAGGVSILTKKRSGYQYSEGMIHSKDGFCRTFDKDSSGTFNSEGAGVVALKRMKDAIADGDKIYAVIKGSAINNDGNKKVGYTAPSIEGQAECIRKAQKFAKVQPNTITYVEAHGTATELGDPIELEALNIAFDREEGDHCALGSVKSNIGHLNTAAGVAGLIKAALAISHKQIPPSLHYNEPNPNLNFDGGPFFVNNELKEWNRKEPEIPLRAGVSSFGIGGTNAHVILEEPPAMDKALSEKSQFLLTLSAKSEVALNNYIEKLGDHVESHPDINLPDLCHSLFEGRRTFDYRKSLAFKSYDELLHGLSGGLTSLQPTVAKINPKVVFMFPGAGSQYRKMGYDLYLTEPYFRDQIDLGLKKLEELTGIDYNGILFASDEHDLRVNEMLHTQPLIFLFEHALGKLLIHCGVQPDYMIGHSIGEYAAACLSGIFDFDDALQLVVKRGELMDSLAGGAMVSVALGQDEIDQYLVEGVSLAAINAPQQMVISGDVESVQKSILKLEADEVQFVKLYATQAGHSAMMEKILDQYATALDAVKKNQPNVPFVSNISGDFITEEEAASTGYWVNHMRQTVNFLAGIETLYKLSANNIFLEIGAGHGLCGLLKQYGHLSDLPTCINLVRSSKDEIDDFFHFNQQLGKLWSNGITIKGEALSALQGTHKIPLPTYAFEHSSFPTEVDIFEDGLLDGFNPSVQTEEPSLPNWLYTKVWRSVSPVQITGSSSNQTVLLFLDQSQWSDQLVASLQNRGADTIVVHSGDSYAKITEEHYRVNPNAGYELSQLFSDISDSKREFTQVIYGWNLSVNTQEFGLEESNEAFNRLFFALANIAKEIALLDLDHEISTSVLTANAFKVTGGEEIAYDQSILIG